MRFTALHQKQRVFLKPFAHALHIFSGYFQKKAGKAAVYYRRPPSNKGLPPKHLRPKGKIQPNPCLQRRKQREAHNKIPMLCFMAKQHHTQKATAATHNERRKKQRLFGYPSFSCDCPCFIYPHQKHGNQTAYRQNIPIYLHFFSLADIHSLCKCAAYDMCISSYNIGSTSSRQNLAHRHICTKKAGQTTVRPAPFHYLIILPQRALPQQA